MRAAMKQLNTERGKEDLIVKIGIHEGPCLAVTLNERQDYFGQTVNLAARLQGESRGGDIVLSQTLAPLAEEAGLGVAELAKIDVRGEPIEKVRQSFG